MRPKRLVHWLTVWRAGLVSGVLGAGTVVLVMLVLRDALGVPTTPELLMDRLAPFLPVPVFLLLITIVGGYNQLKLLGVGGILFGILAAGALGGVLYERLRVGRGGPRSGGVHPGRSETRTGPDEPGATRRAASARPGWRPALTLAALVGAVWVLVIGLLWPVLPTQYLGVPPDEARVGTAVGLLLSYAAYLPVLLLTYAAGARGVAGAQGGGDASVAGPRRGRRGLVVGAAGAVLGLGVTGMLSRLFVRSALRYDGLEYLGADLQPITPTDRFYVVTKNVVDPTVDRARWRLEVRGAVERARTLRFEDLAASAPVTQETTLMCISNRVGAGLISNAQWTGVRLRDLLQEAGPSVGVIRVRFHAADGYTETIPLEKAMDPTTLVAYAMNGEPLPQRHGFPARLIIPGVFGEKSVKWVTRIEPVEQPVKGFYEQQGWGPNFVIPTRSRFDTPLFTTPVRAGASTVLRGIAFGGDRGVSQVEVSADGGDTWQEATLTYPGTRLSWALWRYDWRPPRAGPYPLVVRATDGTGAPQIATDRDTAPEGATGYHRVLARVGA